MIEGLPVEVLSRQCRRPGCCVRETLWTNPSLERGAEELVDD
jgi:hypothetical protein